MDLLKACFMISVSIFMPPMSFAASFESRLQAIEPQVESIKSRFLEQKKSLKSEREIEALKFRTIEMIYSIYTSITEFFAVPSSAGPAEIFSALLAHEKGFPEDQRELNALMLCSNGIVRGCYARSAFGVEGSIPREVTEAMGYFLLKDFASGAGPLVFIDAHTHPLASITGLYVAGNPHGNPTIQIENRESLLSGPSAWDCMDFHGRSRKRYLNIKKVSVVLDVGGIWLCRSDWPQDVLNSAKAKALMKAREKLIIASQRKTGKKLELEIKNYTQRIEDIYKSQRLKIRYLPISASDSQILKVAAEIAID